MRIASAGTILTIAVATACSSPGSTSSAPAPLVAQAGDVIAPALDAIRIEDIRRDLFAMAGDAMRGREAGTLDEMRATAWVAERAREAGLEPAGDDSTYFQWWNLRRTRLSQNSQISVGGKTLRLWQDVVTLSNQPALLDVPIVYVADSAALATTDVRGKAVAMELPQIATQAEGEFTIRGNFTTTITQMVRVRASAIARAGAAAAILVSNGSANIDAAWVGAAAVTSLGSFAIDTAGGPSGPYAGGGRGRGGAMASVPTIWLKHDMLDAVRAPNAKFNMNLFNETFYYPSGNVVGVVRGTDPKLANEYVLFSAHQDHDGVRYPVMGDSIWNGADDNATASVALLAAARAFVKHPAPRPILFVWHGAEERGLLGSRWFASHPTVPRSQIIAVLNADMIGRNHPDSAVLFGAEGPHKNSNALAAAALRVNSELTHFKLDTLWDKPGHPEGFYFRSDHLPYARLGVPALMFSTVLHPDYHTPRDEPSRIDYAKLTKVAQWMYATGWVVATAPQRPDVVPGFKLER